MFLLMRSAEGAEKSKIEKTEHIDSRQRRRYRKQREKKIALHMCLCKNFILRKESREGRYSADGKNSDKEDDVGDWQFPSKSAHLSYVLLSTHSMNNAAGCKKEQ